MDRVTAAGADYIAFIDLSLPNGFSRHARDVAGFLTRCGIETELVSFDNIGSSAALKTLRLFFLSLKRIAVNPGLVILSTQANYLQVFLALAARLRGRTIFYDMQDLTPESFLHLYRKALPPFALSVGAAWLRFSEWLICRLSNAVLVVSPGMRAIVGNRTGNSKKIFLYPNSHSLMHVPEKSRSAQPTIVYAGGLQPLYRGIERQLDAIALLPGWQMWIAGEGDPAWLIHHCNRLCIEDRVTLHGFIPPTAVHDLLAQSHILVIEGVSYGLPSKFFEAVSAGVVVVTPQEATDVTTILGDAAVTFGSTPEELSRALLYAWHNVETLRRSQRDRLERFIQWAESESRALAAVAAQRRTHAETA